LASGSSIMKYPVDLGDFTNTALIKPAPIIVPMMWITKKILPTAFLYAQF
jgi:hypothetical protein